MLLPPSPHARAQTHAEMRVLSTTASVEQGGPTWSTTFTALRDIEYKVEMRPSDSLLLSAVQVIAPFEENRSFRKHA